MSGIVELWRDSASLDPRELAKLTSPQRASRYASAGVTYLQRVEIEQRVRRELARRYRRRS